MSVDLCYVISHGFAARMILHSELLEEACARGLSVAVIAPDVTDAPVVAKAERLGVSLLLAPEPAPRRANVYGQLRPYLYENIIENPALRAKHLRAKVQGGHRRRLAERGRMTLNRVLSQVPTLQRVAAGLERSLLRTPAAESLLERLEPRMLVATYPVSPIESALLLAARDRSIRTVGHLLSWDNITAKGRFAVPPERYIAWGPIMREELADHYGVPAAHVREVGVPHFDAHVSAPDPAVRRHHLGALGLDADRPYLFFGMSSPYFAPREIDLVEHLAAEVGTGRWGESLQLLVRPHPQNVHGHLADQSWLPRLEALEHFERVAVDYPTLRPSKMLWNMDPSDLARLSNLLAGAAVTLNSGSTLSIDAIVHDRPVVLTSYDHGADLPWHLSARRAADYVHLAKLIAMGGLQVARSWSELDIAIRRYLDEPTADAAGREATRQRELLACDGQSAARAADALVALLDET